MDTNYNKPKLVERKGWVTPNYPTYLLGKTVVYITIIYLTILIIFSFYQITKSRICVNQSMYKMLYSIASGLIFASFVFLQFEDLKHVLDVKYSSLTDHVKDFLDCGCTSYFKPSKYVLRNGRYVKITDYEHIVFDHFGLPVVSEDIPLASFHMNIYLRRNPDLLKWLYGTNNKYSKTYNNQTTADDVDALITNANACLLTTNIVLIGKETMLVKSFTSNKLTLIHRNHYGKFINDQLTHNKLYTERTNEAERKIIQIGDTMLQIRNGFVNITDAILFNKLDSIGLSLSSYPKFAPYLKTLIICAKRIIDYYNANKSMTINDLNTILYNFINKYIIGLDTDQNEPFYKSTLMHLNKSALELYYKINTASALPLLSDDLKNTKLNYENILKLYTQRIVVDGGNRQSGTMNTIINQVNDCISKTNELKSKYTGIDNVYVFVNDMQQVVKILKSNSKINKLLEVNETMTIDESLINMIAPQQAIIQINKPTIVTPNDYIAQENDKMIEALANIKKETELVDNGAQTIDTLPIDDIDSTDNTGRQYTPTSKSIPTISPINSILPTASVTQTTINPRIASVTQTPINPRIASVTQTPINPRQSVVPVAISRGVNQDQGRHRTPQY